MYEKIGQRGSVDWDDLRLFLSVAREGGLAPAARASGCSAATLGRRMLDLERQTGRDLFQRHERGYDLTLQGRELLEQLQSVEAQLLRLTVPPLASGKPLVKLSAGTWITHALLDRLDSIAGRGPGSEPDVRLRFLSSEQTLSIARREISIGLRNQRPCDDALVGRQLSRVDFAPYARPDAPDRWIRVIAETPSAKWVQGLVGDDAVCEVSAPRSSLDLAIAGQGIALLPTFIGVGQPLLEQRGAVVPELTHDLWLVTHQEDRNLPHVRRVIDRICKVMDLRRPKADAQASISDNGP